MPKYREPAAPAEHKAAVHLLLKVLYREFGELDFGYDRSAKQLMELLTLDI